MFSPGFFPAGKKALQRKALHFSQGFFFRKEKKASRRRGYYRRIEWEIALNNIYRQ